MYLDAFNHGKEVLNSNRDRNNKATKIKASTGGNQETNRCFVELLQRSYHLAVDSIELAPEPGNALRY